jgi:hypothetical protein
MTCRRLLSVLPAALLALACLALPLAGQEKDKKDTDTDKDKDPSKTVLKWKFEKNKTFYQTMTTDTKQTMKVMNNDVNQTQKQTFYFSWTPLKEEKDGWLIQQKIIGVAMDIDIGGSKISYDSTKESNATNPLGEFFKALVDSEFTITLNTKTMEVTKVEGREKFIDKLTKANPQMKQLLEQILSEKALKEMAEPTFAVVPPKEGEKKWTKKTTLDMGPIGKYDNEYTYTDEGKDDKEKKLEKIKVDTTLKYAPPSGDVAGQGGLPFKIVSADLKSTNATGTILFDTEKGRVDSSTMKLDLKGELSIEIGGQKTKVELSQTQETTVTTSDDNPVSKKK